MLCRIKYNNFKLYNKVIVQPLSTAPLTNDSKCPITGTSSNKNNNTTSTAKSFESVPGPKRYPIIGSIRDIAKHGGISQAHQAYYKEYGPIVRQNLGRGDEVVIYDPREYLNVYRNDGVHPVGGSSEFWPFDKPIKKSGGVINIMQNGDQWRHTRTGLQGDILSPQAGQSYLPLFIPSVRAASEAFPRLSNDLQEFVTRSAFDMFTAAMVGKSTGSLLPNPDPKGTEFIKITQKVFQMSGDLIFSPYESLVQKYYDTPKYKEYSQLFSKMIAFSSEMARNAVAGVKFAEANSNNNVNEDQSDLDATQEAERMWIGEGVEDVKDAVAMSDCYVRKTYERGLLEIDTLTNELTFLFLAGVDTTSNYLNWFIYHLASHPEIQDRLAAELKTVLNGNDYSKDISKSLPYLRACYRETHRYTPLNPTTTSRMHTKDIILNGYHIPAGTRMNFNLKEVQHDPKYCDNPDIYIPERWLEDAVAARKGTEKELLDHRLLATPFSFGARMCLGGRLAEAEIMALITRIVQDWRFEIAPGSESIKPIQKLFLVPDKSAKLIVTSRN